jgi:hypothetical protein
VALGWDASPAAAAAGYRLYYGLQSRTYSDSIDVGGSTTWTVSGLTSGQTYYFAVTVYDHARSTESAFSNEVSTQLPESGDTDDDGLLDSEETGGYGTDPMLADTDGDGSRDGEEVHRWGSAWGLDADGDGLINLLDPDADNDGAMDGAEIAAGTDPADPTSRPALGPGEIITLEAEEMDLTGYLRENNSEASEGALISRRGASGTPPGVATGTFPGPADSYEITVWYFDENDGRGGLTLVVNGTPVDAWSADADLPASGASAVTLTSRVVASELPLVPGDVIVLEGSEHQEEYARLDKIEFVPVRRDVAQ